MDKNETALQLLKSWQTLSTTVECKRTADSVKGTFFALNYLYERGCVVVPGEISAAMSVSSARIAMLLNTLESRGYIFRVADEDDHRRVDVSLTDAGRSYVEKQRQAIFDGMVRIVEKLGEDDVNNYIRITGRIVDISCRE